jgi:hypothetical protein
MKTTAFKTLKTISGLDFDIMQGVIAQPDEIIMAIQEAAKPRKESPSEEVVRIEYEKSMLDSLTNRGVHAILQRSFGKWLPKNADAIVKDALEGLNSTEDKIASLVWAIERIKGLENWKKQQSIVRKAQRHNMKTNTRKAGGKWCEAEVYELPPLMVKVSNGVETKFVTGSEAYKLLKDESWKAVKSDHLQHEPTRYIFKHNGTTYDLGSSYGKFSPILRNNPDEAMRSIATRLDMNIRGGACEIIRAITGNKEVIPAYLTIWFNDCWLTIVSYQKDAKNTPSSYYLEDDKLTLKPVADQEPLTIAELDYHILKDTSDLEIQDENETVIDFEDPEEASYNMGLERDQPSEAINTDCFAEDDRELEFINFMRGKIDRSESFITMGDLQGREAKETLREGLATAKEQAAKFSAALDKTGNMLYLKLYNGALARIEFYQRQIETYKMIMTDASGSNIIDYWYRPTAPFINHSKETVKIIPNAHLAPEDKIETRPVLHVDSMEAGRIGSLRRSKRGTTAVFMESGSIVKKDVPKLPEAKITAKNANPALKRTLINMINDSFKYTPERAARKAFANAFTVKLAEAIA